MMGYPMVEEMVVMWESKVCMLVELKVVRMAVRLDICLAELLVGSKADWLVQSE